MTLMEQLKACAILACAERVDLAADREGEPDLLQRDDLLLDLPWRRAVAQVERRRLGLGRLCERARPLNPPLGELGPEGLWILHHRPHLIEARPSIGILCSARRIG